MREHANLSSVVRFVRQHVAQHFRSDRPGSGPTVSAKFFDVAGAAERIREHLLAPSGTLGQSRSRLTPRAVSAFKPLWSL